MRFIFGFLIVLAMAVQANAQEDYRLKPGDEMEVTVFQEPSLNRSVIVRPDGRISFPLVGHINAADRTLEAVENELKDNLQTYYNADLDVTVILTRSYLSLGTLEERHPVVYLTGEVRSPGAMAILHEMTVVQAIAKAGGLGPFAAKARIQIRRTVNGQNYLFPFDWGEVERGFDLTSNIVLQHGDVIVVPERGLFE